MVAVTLDPDKPAVKAVDSSSCNADKLLLKAEESKTKTCEPCPVVPQLKSFLCCHSLRTGTQIIGWIHTVLSLMVTTYIVCFLLWAVLAGLEDSNRKSEIELLPIESDLISRSDYNGGYREIMLEPSVITSEPQADEKMLQKDGKILWFEEAPSKTEGEFSYPKLGKLAEETPSETETGFLHSKLQKLVVETSTEFKGGFLNPKLSKIQTEKSVDDKNKAKEPAVEIYRSIKSHIFDADKTSEESHSMEGEIFSMDAVARELVQNGENIDETHGNVDEVTEPKMLGADELRIVEAMSKAFDLRGNKANGDETNGDAANGDKVNGDGANGDKVNGDKVNGDKVNGDGANGNVIEVKHEILQAADTETVISTSTLTHYPSPTPTPPSSSTPTSIHDEDEYQSSTRRTSGHATFYFKRAVCRPWRNKKLMITMITALLLAVLIARISIRLLVGVHKRNAALLKPFVRMLYTGLAFDVLFWLVLIGRVVSHNQNLNSERLFKQSVSMLCLFVFHLYSLLVVKSHHTELKNQSFDFMSRV